MHGKIKVIAACALTALVVGGSTAEAGHLIRNHDIAKGTISLNRLTPGVQRLITQHATDGTNGKNGKNGAPGGNGTNGSTGPRGPQGYPGPTGDTGPQGSPGAPGADGTNGGLPKGFAVTNKSVALTKSGVSYGPYADGGAAGGSLYYDGLNGKKLSDVTDLGFTFSYSSSDGSPIATPYLRIFLNDDSTDVVLDPSQCATTKVPEGTSTTLNMQDVDYLRYDDDACGANYTPLTLAQVQADHGDDVISGIYVSQGFAGGTDVSATLTGLSVNGSPFSFGS